MTMRGRWIKICIYCCLCLLCCFKASHFFFIYFLLCLLSSILLFVSVIWLNCIFPLAGPIKPSTKPIWWRPYLCTVVTHVRDELAVCKSSTFKVIPIYFHFVRRSISPMPIWICNSMSDIRGWIWKCIAIFFFILCSPRTSVDMLFFSVSLLWSRWPQLMVS